MYQTLELRKHDLPQLAIWNVPSPPEKIYVMGRTHAFSILNRLPQCGLAVVGTRYPQSRTVLWTENLIRDLAKTDLIIISGLARGIDTIAHTTALRFGLPTIAVLGSGLNRTYPRENQGLRQEILSQGGLVMTEYEPNTPSRPFQFLQRNRLIAGWAKAICVMEAGFRSGALNTAKWAREQNKLTFAIPCYPEDPFLAGNQVLLDRDHALPLWGPHSLGAAWLELATLSTPRKSVLPPPAEDIEKRNSLLKLTLEIERRTFDEGGVSRHHLLDWALNNGWNSHEFFVTLREAIRTQVVLERLGVLIKNPDFASLAQVT
ncbi:MAG: DNA-protecting protein DprA [Bdellovibrio sp.]|nr:DNA-protecting protein DprA [Bdellovibrio sp.]